MLFIKDLILRLWRSLSANPAPHRPPHLVLGQRGEDIAYCYLERLGYRIIAGNFRAPHERGEIDLIGWDGRVLCFIEVKTRSNDSFAPPSTAVTAAKRRNIRAVARCFLRTMHGVSRPHCRFDIVSVVCRPNAEAPEITLRTGAFGWDTDDRPRKRHLRDWVDRRPWKPLIR